MIKKAIILLNMGGPNNLDEVEIFLKNMFKDKNILTMKSDLLRTFIGGMIVFNRTESSQEIYKKIGGKSPIVEHTQKLVKKLQERVSDDTIVDYVMRYTPPFANEVIAKLQMQEIDNIYLIPLYPQYSTTTTKSSLEDFYEAYHKNNGDAVIHELKHFFQNEKYNQSIIENIKNTLLQEKVEEFDLIFSAHGLPQNIIDKGDVYEKHIQKHIIILSKMLKEQNIYFKNIHLAYQSKVGPMKWLKPSLEDTLQTISNKKVIIFPIAFTIDNSETDYELEIEYREIAEKLGYEKYKVSRCPNDSELFVETLFELYTKMAV